MGATQLTEKIVYTNLSNVDTDICLYDDYTKFGDYDNGDYIAIQIDDSKIGYVYCSSTLTENEDYIGNFIDRDGNTRYIYAKDQNEEPISSEDIIKMVITTGYDVYPLINNNLSFDAEKIDTEKDSTSTIRLMKTKNGEDITSLTFNDSRLKRAYLQEVLYVNTAKLTTMSGMFSNCSALTYVDTGNIKTDNITNMSSLFANSTKISSVDMSKLNTGNVTTMSSIFSGCSSIQSIDLTKNDLHSLTTLGSAFKSTAITTFYADNMLVSDSLTDISLLFANCKSLKSADLSKLNTKGLTKMHALFNQCTNLISANLDGLNTPNLTSLYNLFALCNKVTEIHVANLDVSKVKNFNNIFNGCKSLVELDLSGWYTTSATSVLYTFGICESLQKLDIRNFDTRNVTGKTTMFTGVPSTCEIYVGSNFTLSEADVGFTGTFIHV